MTKVRSWLPSLVKGMFLLLILAFLLILVRGAMFSKNDRAVGLSVNGVVSLENKKGNYYWLNHYSAAQLAVREQLDESVVEPNAGCPVSLSVCSLSAETGRQGVRILYSQEMPSSLKADTLWYGGYINPVDGAVYDLFGRAYKFNKDIKQVSLKVVQH